MNYSWIVGGLWLVFFAYWGISSLKVNKTEQSEAWSSRSVHLALMVGAFALVGLDQFSAGVLAIRFLPEGSALWGVIVEAIGIGFAIWARYHLGQYWSGTITIKEGHRLIQTGPYALVRHPIYTGFVTAMLGTALVVGEVRGLIAVILVIVAYWRKIGLEEGFLKTQFGQEYIRYCHAVKALIPFVF